MSPPIFQLCSADSSCESLLRGEDNVFRLFQFGEATERTARPYAVWQIVDGEPENYLDKTPDMDSFVLQVEAYGDTAQQARDVAAALRAVIETVAHVTRHNGEWRDATVRAYVCSFTVDWFVER